MRRPASQFFILLSAALLAFSTACQAAYQTRFSVSLQQTQSELHVPHINAKQSLQSEPLITQQSLKSNDDAFYQAGQAYKLHNKIEALLAKVQLNQFRELYSDVKHSHISQLLDYLQTTTPH